MARSGGETPNGSDRWTPTPNQTPEAIKPDASYDTDSTDDANYHPLWSPAAPWRDGTPTAASTPTDTPNGQNRRHTANAHTPAAKRALTYDQTPTHRPPADRKRSYETDSSDLWSNTSTPPHINIVRPFWYVPTVTPDSTPPQQTPPPRRRAAEITPIRSPDATSGDDAYGTSPDEYSSGPESAMRSPAVNDSESDTCSLSPPAPLAAPQRSSALSEHHRHASPEPPTGSGAPLPPQGPPPDEYLTPDNIDDVDAVIADAIPAPAPIYNPPRNPIAYRNTLAEIWPHTSAPAWRTAGYYKTIYDQVRRCAVPNYCGKRIPIPSGLNIPEWRRLLNDYHDDQLVDFLEYGWPADYTGDLPPVAARTNHVERPDNTDHIREYVEEEVRMGALLGPFQDPPFVPWTQISPMMTRPKKNSSKRRVIVDLSYPGKASVNAGIRRGQYQGTPYNYRLPGVTDLADEVSRLGPACYMWCADLARAYRQLRACPLSTPLYGITLDGNTYIDIAPPFGCRTSSMACARTTGAVVHIMRECGYHVMCYLDDFVGIAASYEGAYEAYQAMLTLARTLGLDLAPKKCIAPTTDIQWLGYDISSMTMRVEIPSEKMDEVITECDTWSRATYASRKDLQRLVGRLQHIARCVRPARRFMSRILAALRAAPFTGRHAVPDDLKLDIDWFRSFARSSNGCVLIHHQQRIPWLIECDSSLTGGGARSITQYYGQAYPHHLLSKNLNIAALEALNLVAAVKALAPSQASEYVLNVYTDNSASQQVMTTGSGQDPTLCACARELWLYTAIHDTEIVVRHKPGKDLTLVDALSRRHDDDAAKRVAAQISDELCLEPITPNFDNILSTI